VLRGEAETMIEEKGLDTIKAEIQYQLAKLAFKGIKIKLYEWNENHLKINTINDENALKIADLLQQQCGAYINSISISVCGDTNEIQL
jgi:hypothetical protein